MFSLAAGMGWFTTLPAANEDGSLNFGVIFFVVSFVVIVNWTLLQVLLGRSCQREIVHSPIHII